MYSNIESITSLRLVIGNDSIESRLMTRQQIENIIFYKLEDIEIYLIQTILNVSAL